jgi:mannitol/fructose-specific phosphotransferase system IIA component (Ntr-type)
MRFWQRKMEDPVPPAVVPAVAGRRRISEILKPGNVYLFASPITQVEAFTRLVQDWAGVDPAAVLSAIFDRERIGPTVIDGVTALPHARVAAFGPLRAALGICPQGFNDGPGHPRVRIVLLFVSDSSQPKESLAFLSSVAAIFGQEGLVDRLLQHADREGVLEVLREAEARGGVS